MRQIQPDVERGLDSLRQQIDTALEEMIASRIDSGEVVELSGRVLPVSYTHLTLPTIVSV